MRQAQVSGSMKRSAAAAVAAAESAAVTGGRLRRLQSAPQLLLDGGESAGLRDVAHQVARVLGFESAAVWLLLPEYEELALVAEWSQSKTTPDEPGRSAGPVMRLAEAPLLAEAVRQRRVVQAQAAERVAAIGTASAPNAGLTVVVPVDSMGAVAGCLVLRDRARRPLADHDLALVAALGSPTGAALNNARRLHAQKERNRQLDSLLTSIRAMTSSATLADVLDVVAAQAAVALAVPSTLIYEYVEESDSLVLRADIDRGPGSQREDEIGDAYSLADYPSDRALLEAGEIAQQCLSDELLDERTRATMVEHGERSCLSVPLSFKGQVVGLLEIVEKRWERVFTQAERDMAHGIGEQAAAAIVNARLYRDQEFHAHRLATLLEVGRAIASSMELPELLEKVARVSAEALDARICVVLEFDPAADRLVFRAGYDRDGAADEVYWNGFTYSLDDFPGDRVILEGRRAVVELLGDPGLDPTTRIDMERWGERTYLNVPLAYAGELLGVLQFIETDSEREFSREEVAFAEGVGEQAAVAVHNARRYRELRDATDALESQLLLRHNLLELSEVLLTLRESEAVFEHIAAVLGMLVAYESLEISLVDLATNELVEAFEGEGSVNKTLGLRMPIGEGVCGRVMASRQPEMVNDMLRDPNAVQVPGTDEEEQASIIVPLQIGGENIGVLSMSRFQGRIFAEREFQLVQLVTNLTAIAIQNARLYGELKDKAIRDGLTGLYNHRHFYERLAQEVARSQRYGTPLSLLMIDLDDFKRFNDRHGHLVGDEALSAVARCLAAEVRRDVDIVARYGGEEFAVLLPNTACGEDGAVAPEAADATLAAGERPLDGIPASSPQPDAATGLFPVGGPDGAADPDFRNRAPGCAAATVAERIRARIADEVLRSAEDRSDGRLTVSIGVATLPDVAYDGQQLVRYADKALYLAKRLGKDRVEIYRV
jgi:GAF domain-containing protein